MATQNEFQDQLNAALEKIQNTYSEEVAKDKAALKNANTTLTGATADQKNAQQHVKETRKLTDDVNTINSRSELAGLIAKNAITLATSGNTNSSKAATDVTTAAKAIDAMDQSVTLFASTIASVYTKVNSEDESSDMAKLATSVFEQSKTLGLQSEKTLVLSLDAAISSAKTTTAKVLETVTTSSQNVDALTAGLTKMLTDLQTQYTTMSKTLTDTTTAEEAAKLSVTEAENELESAEMIGGTNGDSLTTITGGSSASSSEASAAKSKK